jgi:RNA polymerase sigma-70 factor (ECF subfamily)
MLPVTHDEAPGLRLDTSSQACAIGSPASPAARMRAMVDGQYDAVWRMVRFLGVPDASADDVAQHVFCIAARRLGEITPGAERSFLLSTAWRVASEHRRAERRHPVTYGADVDDVEAPLPSPEELLDQKRARIALQSVISAMPAELRMVFVLYEIEEMSLPEIAATAGVPLGTVTSRLRRAREAFQSIVKRRNAAARSSVRKGEP